MAPSVLLPYIYGLDLSKNEFGVRNNILRFKQEFFLFFLVFRIINNFQFHYKKCVIYVGLN